MRGNDDGVRQDGRDDEHSTHSAGLAEDSPHRVSYDTPAKRPSQAVVEAVSEVTDTNLTDIGPLYSAIDPEALDKLFRRDDGRGAPTGRVTFALDGHEVTVRSGGVVEVRADGDDE
ncbi:HalOD1 output domain-containing protein [Halorussus salinus]|uniref:HalOD1 output domain-containing protein n=1 Tax=Halorussus salinus TaxID=1364935 RepID=UPI001091A103|nr:HalOD1 output domain-containing protein [Halorussus salinus]